MTPELEKKVQRAVKLIQSAGKVAEEHGQPLEICYSGGKDSDVILELARMSGANIRPIYKNTTIDPPLTIKHVKEKGVEIQRPKMTFREVLWAHGMPNRFRRVCCKKLKEYKVLDYAVVGIRRDESTKRAKIYHEPEICRVYNAKEKTRQYLPILEWSSDDVAQFITEKKIQCHPLYYDEQGNFHVERRLGCIGCPLMSQKHRIAQFERYPRFMRLYIKCSQQFLDTHPNNKIHGYFKDAYEWMAFTLYCDNLIQFNERFGSHNLFGTGIDCKKFLEQRFNIEL